MDESKYLRVLQQVKEETRELTSINEWVEYDSLYKYPDHENCKPSQVQSLIRKNIALQCDGFRKKHGIVFDEWELVYASFSDKILIEVHFNPKYKMKKHLREFIELAGMEFQYGYSQWNKSEGEVYSAIVRQDQDYLITGRRVPVIPVGDDYWDLLRMDSYKGLLFDDEIVSSDYDGIMDFTNAEGEVIRAYGVRVDVFALKDLTDEYVQRLGYPNVDSLRDYLPHDEDGRVFAVCFNSTYMMEN